MYVEPESLEGRLLAYGISDPAAELRRIMAQKLGGDEWADSYCGEISFLNLGSIAFGKNEGHSWQDLFAHGDYGNQGDSGHSGSAD